MAGICGCFGAVKSAASSKRHEYRPEVEKENMKGLDGESSSEEGDTSPPPWVADLEATGARFDLEELRASVARIRTLSHLSKAQRTEVFRHGFEVHKIASSGTAFSGVPGLFVVVAGKIEERRVSDGVLERRVGYGHHLGDFLSGASSSKLEKSGGSRAGSSMLNNANHHQEIELKAVGPSAHHKEHGRLLEEEGSAVMLGDIDVVMEDRITGESSGWPVSEDADDIHSETDHHDGKNKEKKRGPVVGLLLTRESYKALRLPYPKKGIRRSHKLAVAPGPRRRYRDSELFRYLADREPLGDDLVPLAAAPRTSRDHRGRNEERTGDEIKTTKEERDMIMQALRGNKLLKNVVTNRDKAWDLSGKAIRVPCRPGKKVVVAGALDCEHFFIVNKGTFWVHQAEKYLSAGESFGELALLYHRAREATVLCTSANDYDEEWAHVEGEEEDGDNTPVKKEDETPDSAELFVLHREHFQAYLQEETKAEQLRVAEAFAAASKTFGKHLTEEELHAISETLVYTEFEPGTELLRLSETLEAMYLVTDGGLKRVALDAAFDEEQISVHAVNWERDLSSCLLLGEQALLKNTASAETVVSTSRVQAYCLRRITLELLMGTEKLSFLLDPERMSERRSTISDRNSLVLNESEMLQYHLDAQQSRAGGQSTAKRDTAFHKPWLEMSELRKVGLLGCGAFGAVTLVKDKKNHYYALKQMSKGHVVQSGLQQAVLNEKRLLQIVSDCHFVVKLCNTYKDSSNLFLLMSLAPGGELGKMYETNHLHGVDWYVRFHTACVVEALDFFHSKHIVFRDLKGENVLIDAKGYAVLADLGLAKLIVGRTYTCCGTPLYFAPEVISGKGHSFEFDWWSLGVVFFEMNMGFTPYEADSVDKIYSNIKRNNIADFEEMWYETGGSYESWSFFSNLCKSNPHERLPMRKGKMENVLVHPYFMIAPDANTAEADIADNGYKYVDEEGNVVDPPPSTTNSKDTPKFGSSSSTSSLKNKTLPSQRFFDWQALEAGRLEGPFLSKTWSNPEYMVFKLNVNPSWMPPQIPYKDDGTHWDREF
ncbi:unnamed protein product [Amoebophrya sp. A120]|nr:unnamed protein product [Amoebophrya sp. A120]|eukprot:GSA120T00003052001.1